MVRSLSPQTPGRRVLMTFCLVYFFIVLYAGLLMWYCRCEIRSAELMYALDEINVTASDLQKLNNEPTEVCNEHSFLQHWEYLTFSLFD